VITETGEALRLLDYLGASATVTGCPSNERRVAALIQRCQGQSAERLAKQQCDMEVEQEVRVAETNQRLMAEQARAGAASRSEKEHRATSEKQKDVATFWRRIALGGLIGGFAILLLILCAYRYSLQTRRVIVVVAGIILYFISLYRYAHSRSNLRTFLLLSIAEFAGALLVDTISGA
jgi:cation transport ATPase